MASSEAQRRASKKYMKEKTHPMTMRFYPAEEDLWQHLQKQPNKQVLPAHAGMIPRAKSI